jgi:hypothetical protein
VSLRVALTLETFHLTAVQRSPLFHFALSEGPRILVECVAVVIRSVFTVFEQAVGKAFLQLADTSSHLANTVFIVRRSSAGETVNVTF